MTKTGRFGTRAESHIAYQVCPTNFTLAKTATFLQIRRITNGKITVEYRDRKGSKGRAESWLDLT